MRRGAEYMDTRSKRKRRKVVSYPWPPLIRVISLYNRGSSNVFHLSISQSEAKLIVYFSRTCWYLCLMERGCMLSQIYSQLRELKHPEWKRGRSKRDCYRELSIAKPYRLRLRELVVIFHLTCHEKCEFCEFEDVQSRTNFMLQLSWRGECFDNKINAIIYLYEYMLMQISWIKLTFEWMMKREEITFMMCLALDYLYCLIPHMTSFMDILPSHCSFCLVS